MLSGSVTLTLCRSCIASGKTLVFHMFLYVSPRVNRLVNPGIYDPFLGAHHQIFTGPDGWCGQPVRC